MIKKFLYLLPAVVLLLAAIGFILFQKNNRIHNNSANIMSDIPQEKTGVLQESGKMSRGANVDWWLNSGGIANVDKNNNIASTNMGDLPENSYWQKLYAKNNPTDTDNGYRPQNIFRLVTRTKWQDLSQEVYFNIDKINLSGSKNRNESNGVLLFNRYQDGDNLYYTGIRVDGDVVIKKKIDGKYFTMKEARLFTNEKKYDRVDSPNLIPTGKWLGIKSEVRNIDRDTVEIKLYVDLEQKGDWQLVLETQDKNDQYGASPFFDEGYAGIRTDFMDVKFQDYKITELK